MTNYKRLSDNFVGYIYMYVCVGLLCECYAVFTRIEFGKCVLLDSVVSMDNAMEFFFQRVIGKDEKSKLENS